MTYRAQRTVHVFVGRLDQASQHFYGKGYEILFLRNQDAKLLRKFNHAKRYDIKFPLLLVETLDELNREINRLYPLLQEQYNVRILTPKPVRKLKKSTPQG